jgi:hypothetical protein
MHCCPVDCAVSDWGTWGACSDACRDSVGHIGQSSRVRSRSVIRALECGGVACPALQDVGMCSPQPCPVHCEVSHWSVWSSCSVSCGGATVSRNRNITVPAANGGHACPWLEETQLCGMNPCPSDCVVSSWSAWSTCSVGCGDKGLQLRLRAVLAPAHHQSCSHPLREHQACGDGSPCPINCEVSDFGAWGGCDSSCGSGTHVRSRLVMVYPMHDGAGCPDLTSSRRVMSSPVRSTAKYLYGATGVAAHATVTVVLSGVIAT